MNKTEFYKMIVDELETIILIFIDEANKNERQLTETEQKYVIVYRTLSRIKSKVEKEVN